ncbi:MAG TPA: STAS domain-containing protein [Candidatus Baltobacteraceae bacterium]|nr:STAS domain-containing protein [Candidatus Baltobacteraceae bacterium]
MRDQPTAHVAFAGDLDVYRRDEVASALPPPETAERIVIDMRDVTTVDSSIVAVLMRYRRSFTDAGGDAHEVVLIVSPQLRRIFEITGLTRSMTVVTAGPLTEA